MHYLCSRNNKKINDMKKLVTMAAANNKKEMLTNVKNVNNEVKLIKDARKSASEVIRMAQATKQRYMLATLLVCTDDEAAKMNVKRIKEAVNALYPWKSKGLNVKPSTAYIKRNNGVYAVKVYKPVSDYLEALQRAAKAKIRNEKQQEVLTDVYYLKNGEIIEEIPFAEVEAANAVEYREYCPKNSK